MNNLGTLSKSQSRWHVHVCSVCNGRFGVGLRTPDKKQVVPAERFGTRQLRHKQPCRFGGVLAAALRRV